MKDGVPFRELSRPMQVLTIVCLILGLAFTFGLAWGPLLYAALYR